MSDDKEKAGSILEPAAPLDGDATLNTLQRVKTADAAHPSHWSGLKKWTIITIYCVLQVFVTITSTSYVSAEFLVEEKFNKSTQIVTLGQSMFILGNAVGPAFLGPLSYVPLPPP